MNSGKHQIAQFKYGIDAYYIVCNKVDDDPGLVGYYIYITRGDWRVSSPEIVASTNFYSADESSFPNADVYFNTLLTQLNQQLVEYLKPKPEPDVWVQKMVDNTISLTFTKDGALQVKERNWGANVEMNKWMATRTGYSGDFGSGGFAAWCTANGLDINALVAEYNAQK